MGFRDVREWMEKLEPEGEFKRIKAEVNWNREIGTIARKVSDKMGPALLFENIKDHKTTQCTKVFFGSLGSYGRIAMMLDLPKDTSIKELIEVTRRRFKEPIKPTLVSTGPVKENIIKGDNINLYEFPVPFIHKEDGGRFFNTDCAVITKDPDTGIVNIGTYRGMLVGKDKVTVRGVSLGRAATHGGQHYLKFRGLDKPMPIAVAFNWDPAMKYVSASAIPAGVCEYDVMGGVRQEPVPLVKCETIDLEVPAWAEIVIEGTVLHDSDTFAWDGPFGEYTGYYGGTKTLSPVMKVECIAYRNDPIYTFALVGVGPGHPEEAAIMMQISGAALLWNSLETAGVPGVRDLYLLPASYGQTVAVQIHKTYLGQAKQVAMAIWSTRYSEGYCKNVIVVDDDIDVYNFEALEWAIAYRVNPGENDIVVVPGTHGSVLDPSVRVKDREPRLGTAKWNRLLIDATKNWEYEPQEQYGGDIYPPVAFLLDPEDEALVKKRWKEYGLP